MNAPARITLIDDVSPASAGAATPRDHLAALAAVGLAAGYATVRYNVFKGVPWSDWPAYTANKALAVAGLLLLAQAGWRKLGRKPGRTAGHRASTRVPMAWAGALILSHALVSFGLFTPAYFGKFFADGRLNVVGGLSLLAGAAAVGLLELGARSAAGWSRRAWQRSLAGLLALSVVHTAAPGLAGWFDPAGWPGYLPPLTLLACLPALAVLVRQAGLSGRR